MVTEQRTQPVEPVGPAVTELSADRQLKDKHRAMWALGDYPRVADTVIPDLGAVLIEACDIRAGDRVLDVGAGAGNAAIPAARLGADVVASDLTPELLAIGRERAEREGLAMQWDEADAEALPYAADSFDAVVSCVGVMFAPHHAAAAAELARVTRPGGTIGLASWTPDGFIGQMFAAMKPFLAPPPPGVQPPPLWGSEQHLADLFGETLTGIRHEHRHVVVDRFGRAEEFRDFFRSNYGPTVAAYRQLADAPDRAAELDRALVELGRRHAEAAGTMRWECLLTVATVA